MSQGHVGQVAQYDPVTKIIRLVPWQQSFTDRNNRLKRLSVPVPEEVFQEGLPPVVKTSPQAKVKRMTDRLVNEWKRTGVVPLELCQKIQKEYNRQGMPVTAEDLRLVAAALLEDADRKNPQTMRPTVGR